MAIDLVKVRARITLGTLVVETPYIQSFSVNVTRGQVSTFQASIKVSYTKVTGNLGGEFIKIQAGRNSASTTIFTGIVLQAQISPVYDDPSFVMISLSGEDFLHKLNGKKYTRRCKATTASWVTIDGVTRKGLRSGKFKVKRSDLLSTYPAEKGDNSSEVSTTTPLANSIKTNAKVANGQNDPYYIEASAAIVEKPTESPDDGFNL